MTINWFPGHMNKARRVLKERAARADVIVEVLDARLPRSSRNPLLDEVCRGLPRLRILTKPDLADEAVTAEWVAALGRPGDQVLPLQVTQRTAARQVVQACRALVPGRGSVAFPVRVMIVGVPNVGKSTLFNALAGGKMAEVRDQPAVTKATQQLDIPGGLSLLDTPGVLWPKFDDQNVAYRLAVSGAIRDAVIDPQDVAEFALGYLVTRYPELLRARYRFAELAKEPRVLLEHICLTRGCLLKGGLPDWVKGGELVLRELRAGQIGRISLETPADWRASPSSESAIEDGSAS